MTFYNLEEEEVTGIINTLGFNIPGDYLKRNFEYYLERTSHGSTLSRVVHAYVAKLTGNNHMCRDMYMDALASDYNDIQGGTTGEGIHVGVMGGTILSALTVFAGLNWQGEALRLDPELPVNWKSFKFNYYFKEQLYRFNLSHDSVKVSCVWKNDNARVFIKGEKYDIPIDKEIEVKIKS